MAVVWFEEGAHVAGSLGLLFVVACIGLACGGGETVPEPVTEPVFTADAEPEDGYDVYDNDRFGYAVSYPESLAGQGEPQNADGQLFVSEDSSVVLIAFGRHLVMQDSIPLLFEDRIETRRGEDGVITYSDLADSAFVVSGTSGDRIYYERSIFYDETMARIEITYPIGRRAELDSMVTRVSRSLTGQRP